MSRHRLAALIFLAVALVQLALPASRIWLYEKILHEGHAYKFKTEPVDPYDAFRGRYVALRFDTGKAAWAAKKDPDYGTKMFVLVETGPDGFARLGAASLEPPTAGDYLQATSTYSSGPGQLGVFFPFDRFYMEENVAPEAEKVYREHSRRDSARDAYAVVRIRDGQGVIEQVYIADQTLAEAARAALAEGTK